MKKYLVWGLVVLYWISPIDLVPGNPIDDIVIVALAYHREKIELYLRGLLTNA